VTVLVREATYYFEALLGLGPEDSGDADSPVTYAGWPGERPLLSGGVRLDLDSQSYKDRITKPSLDPGAHEVALMTSRAHLFSFP